MDFTDASAYVDIDAIAAIATVKSVTMAVGASGLNVNDELTISKGETFIIITAGDGSTIEHIIHFRNPQITISATQLKIVDGTKTDGTTKLPSHFMVFDITTTADIKSQYSVEFLLVKEGSTAPTTLKEFHKTVLLDSDEHPDFKDTDTPMSYKSALFPLGGTSLYLAHDSMGSYPLEQGRSYALYAVQPQATDTTPTNLGSYSTGTPVDSSTYTTTLAFIESPVTANKKGEFFITKEQYFVVYGMIGNDLPTNGGDIIHTIDVSGEFIIANGGLVNSDNPVIWYSKKSSIPQPGWLAYAFLPLNYPSFHGSTGTNTIRFETKFSGGFQLHLNIIE